MLNFTSFSIFESIQQQSISKDDFDKFVEQASNCLGKEGKVVVDFIEKENKGSKEYKWDIKKVTPDVTTALKALKKVGRLQCNPFNLTKDDFDDVKDGKKSLDNVIYDFEKSSSMNELVHEYTPLIKKVASKFSTAYDGKFADDFESAGMEGLSKAIKEYPTKDLKDKDGHFVSFNVFAFQHIRFQIGKFCDREAPTLHISGNILRDERAKAAEEGTKFNTDIANVSGDDVVSTNKDGKEKTRFEKIGGSSTSAADDAEIADVFDALKDLVIKHFGDKVGEKYWDSFAARFISEKERKTDANDRVNIGRVKKFLMSDKEGLKLLSELREIMSNK